MDKQFVFTVTYNWDIWNFETKIKTFNQGAAKEIVRDMTKGKAINIKVKSYEVEC